MKRFFVGVIGFLFIFGMAVWANAEEKLTAITTSAEYKEVYDKFIKEKAAFDAEKLQRQFDMAKVELEKSRLQEQVMKMQYSILAQSIVDQQDMLRDLQTQIRKAAADKVTAEKEAKEAKPEPPKKEPKNTE